MRVSVVTAAVLAGAMGMALSGCTGSPTAQERVLPAAIGEPTASETAPLSGTPQSRPAAKNRRAKNRVVGGEGWRLRRPANGRIEGFTTRISGPAGTRVGLKVSTRAASYRVKAYRIGSYEGGSSILVWASDRQRGELQAPAVFRPAATRTVVAPWKRSLTVDTGGWRPGFYVFKLITGSGREKQVPYVVSSDTAARTVALVSPVTTWQAYNTWGGYSLYRGEDGDQRAYAVSFDRPFHGAPGANDYRSAAVPIIIRAERLGVPLSYFTNIDLHTRPGVLRGALGYVSMGHDEYWTPAMRREVASARDGGTNLAFFSANTMYWRIRLEDRSSGPARVVVGYRSSAYLDPMRDERPAETTARFRDAPRPRPEQDLVGSMYECFPVDEDFVVMTPRWWGFEGTSLRRGDRVEGLVGREADRVYPDSTLPRPLQIVAHTAYDCRGVRTTAQSVYYTTSSGAGVFNAGTLRWGCSMVNWCDRPLPEATGRFTRTVTANLLRGFADGPVGRRHPAHDNVRDFGLSPVNTVSAS